MNHLHQKNDIQKANIPFLECDLDIERRYREIWSYYQPLQAFWRNGQGLVVHAQDCKRKEDVIIKIFDFSKSGNLATIEPQESGLIITRLQGICIDGLQKTIDYKITEDYAYLVEEYMDAPSLQEQIKGGVTFSEAQVLTILRRCLDILSQLHQRKPPILYRDIMPSNILMRQRSYNAFDIYLRGVGSSVWLKPPGLADGYAAPELLRGKSYPSSDLYALGMSMIYILTGKSPNEMRTSDLKVEYEPHLPSMVSKHLKEWLQRIVAENPAERFHTADEALDALNGIPGKNETWKEEESSSGDDQTLGDIERCYPEIGERYRLLKTLGRGGQGLVVKALERQSGQDIAVKIFDLSEAENWKAYELFEREVEVLRYLDIGGVPKYIDYEKKDHYYYLVEEYIEAPSLQEQIEAGVTFSESQVMTILRRCLEILTQLHQKHPPIIHRDIKPSNILTKTRDDGSLDVWLIDFGSVTSVSPKTQMSTIAGTSGYAPPEQFMGKSYPSSDLYALGMSMVHVLTGKSPNEMMTSRLKVEYASHLPPSLSEHLKTWLARVIVSNPKERIQTAKEALKSLNDEGACDVKSQGSDDRAKGEIDADTNYDSFVIKGLLGTVAIILMFCKLCEIAGNGDSDIAKAFSLVWIVLEYLSGLGIFFFDKTSQSPKMGYRGCMIGIIIGLSLPLILVAFADEMIAFIFGTNLGLMSDSEFEHRIPYMIVVDAISACMIFYCVVNLRRLVNSRRPKKKKVHSRTREDSWGSSEIFLDSRGEDGWWNGKSK